MALRLSVRGDLSVTAEKQYESLAELKRDIYETLFPGLEHVSASEDSFYLTCNGRILREDDDVFRRVEGEEEAPLFRVTVVPRVLGGKGGFGSMLRAIGAQIEKTTNRDACRDLSGRRLRDINEEQRLKNWFAKQKEREQEKQEAKKRKLERLRQVADGPPLPKIDDQEYLQKREDMVESVFEAVDKGFEARKSAPPEGAEATNSDSSNSSVSDEKRDISEGGQPQEMPGPSSSGGGSVLPSSGSSQVVKPEKKTFKKTMLDEDLDSCSSDSESSEDETAPKKARLQ